MAPLVFEAPPQDVLVRPVPATLGVRSFHRFPAYVPLTSHRFLRAEWSQQEGMSEHRRPCQFGGALGSGAGESGRARAAHGGSCKICLLRAVHRANLFMVGTEQEAEQGLREAAGERRSLHLRGDESLDGEAFGSLMKLFRQFQGEVRRTSHPLERLATRHAPTTQSSSHLVEGVLSCFWGHWLPPFPKGRDSTAPPCYA